MSEDQPDRIQGRLAQALALLTLSPREILHAILLLQRFFGVGQYGHLARRLQELAVLLQPEAFPPAARKHQERPQQDDRNGCAYAHNHPYNIPDIAVPATWRGCICTISTHKEFRCIE